MDYFSLDIEGNELDVLKTIPFQKYDIKVSQMWYAYFEKIIIILQHLFW